MIGGEFGKGRLIPGHLFCTSDHHRRAFGLDRQTTNGADDTTSHVIMIQWLTAVLPQSNSGAADVSHNRLNCCVHFMSLT